ncbi:MAG: CBS domain-containing protein [Myxococcota bacterium]
MQTLRDVMTPDPIFLAADTPVREALEVLEGGRIRHLPVVEDGQLVGMISDRTLRPWRQALVDLRDGEGGPLAEEVLARPIRAFMHDDVLYLQADRTVVDAIDVMLDFKVGAVPVVQDGSLVGIVSYVDLLELLKVQLTA